MGKSALPFRCFSFVWESESAGVSRGLNAMNKMGCTGGVDQTVKVGQLFGLGHSKYKKLILKSLSYWKANGNA